MVTFPKPEPRAKVKRRRDRARARQWTVARIAALERDGYQCQRCLRRVSDDFPEWHPARAHVNHRNGRGGDRLCDLSNLETLCQSCHMPNGRHQRRPTCRPKA